MTKAKHCWDSTWCGADVFLDSADAHIVFYGACGWPTRWASLPAATWLGRVATWLLVAWAWQRLSGAIVPRRYVSVLTAAWFLVLNSGCHLAGEWAVGGFEAKAVAYGFVLGALSAMVRGRWNATWVWLGAATALHVLVGGWSLVAAALAWALAKSPRPALRTMWRGLLVGAALALAGMIPALWLSRGVDAATMTEANMIYVFSRLPHHLLFHAFAPERLVLFGLLVMAWFLLSQTVGHCAPWLPLHRFAIGALSIAVLGIILDLGLLAWPAVAASCLRFYWFRLADVAVPLAVSVGLPVVLTRGEASGLLTRARAWCVWGAAVIIPLVILGHLFLQHQLDFRPGGIVQSSPGTAWTVGQRTSRYRSWQEACRWIAAHTEEQARFLTPRNQQTFKWYAQRAEVVCWKDIPQDQASIVAWWHVLHEIYPPAVIEDGLGAWSDEQLREIAQRQQVDYILVDRAYTKRRLGLPRVYPESPAAEGWFEVFRANEAMAETKDALTEDGLRQPRMGRQPLLPDSDRGS
jgi:hypothetical protein